MKLKLLFIVVLQFYVIYSSAQLSSFDFNNDTKIKFSLRYGAINTSGVSSDSTKDIKALLIRPLEFDKIQSDVGGYNTSHRFAFIFETFTLAIIDALNGGDFKWGERTASTYIGDFILGWHNHAWNVVYTDNLSLAAGLHWGDYLFGYEPYKKNQNNFENAHEPAGWYGALGPAAMVDVNMANRAVLHLEGSYAFTKKIKYFPDMTANKNYPDPHFINLTAQIRSNSFIYGGMEFVRSINRGSNNLNASRTDLFVGIWF